MDNFPDELLYDLTVQAGAVTGTLYELFQIVFKMRQEAGISRKVQNAANNSSQMSNGKELSMILGCSTLS